MVISFLKENIIRSSCVFLIVLLVYLLLPNNNYTHDCLDYAIAVRDGKNLFHPHHLLYNATGRILYLSCSVDALRLLQTISALSMACCVALLHYILLLRKCNSVWAYFFASCNAVIFCGTSSEMYSITMLFSLISWLPFLVNKEKSNYIVCSAFSAALAMLFHQTAIFSVIILGLGYYKRNKKSAYIFFTISLLTTAAIYIYVASINGITTFQQFIRWLTEYSHLHEASGGAWGKFSLYTIPQSLWGLFSTISYPEIVVSYFVSGEVNVSPWDMALSCISVLLCITFTLLILRELILKRGILKGKMLRGESIFVLLWLLLQSLFTIWWEPNNNEFWVLCLLPLLLFISEEPIFTNKKLLLYMITLLSFTNLIGRAYKDSREENNVILSITKELDKATIKDEDIVLTFSTEIKPYTEYFYHKKVNVFSLGRLSNSGDTKKFVLKDYKAKLDSLNREHTIFILNNELYPDNIVLTYYPQWSAQDYKECYAPYSDRMEIIGYYNRFGKKSILYKLNMPK